MIIYLDSEVGAMNKYHNRMSGQVVDLGGGLVSIDKATHVVDFQKPQNGAAWIQGNLCDHKTYRQFSDGQFDWVYCNHTLEDLYDPFIVLDEIQRIGKHALVGVPHWTREITIASTRDDWERICGWPHHFWLVGKNRIDGAMEFFPKLSWVVAGERDRVSDNLNLEWDGGEFMYRNVHYLYPGKSLRKDLIEWLESRWETE